MTKRRLQNHPDSKCVYGYITLCTVCSDALKSDERKRMIWRHVDVFNVLDGYPCTEECERCGRKGVPAVKQDD